MALFKKKKDDLDVLKDKFQKMVQQNPGQQPQNAQQGQQAPQQQNWQNQQQGQQGFSQGFQQQPQQQNWQGQQTGQEQAQQPQQRWQNQQQYGQPGQQQPQQQNWQGQQTGQEQAQQPQQRWQNQQQYGQPGQQQPQQQNWQGQQTGQGQAQQPQKSWQNQQQPNPEQIKVISVEGKEGRTVEENIVRPNEFAEDKDLQDVKKEYDEAKINSLIIKQVKELIEIDTALNGRIEDIDLDISNNKRKIGEIEKKIFEILEQVRETNLRMDKLVGLYEVVTNQINPFVKKEKKQEEGKGSESKPGESPQQPGSEKEQQTQPWMQGQENKPPASNESQAMPPTQGQKEADSRISKNAEKQALLFKKAAPGQEFLLENGNKIASIYELIEALQNEPEEIISKHLNQQNNDFAKWVRLVFNENALADMAEKTTDRMHMVFILKGYFS